MKMLKRRINEAASAKIGSVANRQARRNRKPAASRLKMKIGLSKYKSFGMKMAWR